jgi:hypothetical protein
MEGDPMRSRLAALAAALALLLTAVPGVVPVAAQDPPPSVCDGLVTSPTDDPVPIATSTGESGECAIITVGGQPAWRWLDAAIFVGCAPPTGAGTTQEKDGWYLWGVTRDASGAIVSQGYVGTSWAGCGTTPRVYHQQLVLQGYDRTISLRVERRRWPFSASKVIGGVMERTYEGTIHVH